MSKSAIKSKAEVKKLLGNTQNLLEDLRMTRIKAGTELRKELAQSRSDVKSDVRRMLNHFHKVRQDLGDDIKKVRAARQASTSAKHIRSHTVETTFKLETPAAKGEAHEEDMLTVVKKHPEGINLAGIADALGIAPVVLGKASKSLLDKRKIRKNEKLYFPAASK